MGELFGSTMCVDEPWGRTTSKNFQKRLVGEVSLTSSEVQKHLGLGLEGVLADAISLCCRPCRPRSDSPFPALCIPSAIVHACCCPSHRFPLLPIPPLSLFLAPVPLCLASGASDLAHLLRLPHSNPNRPLSPLVSPPLSGVEEVQGQSGSRRNLTCDFLSRYPRLTAWGLRIFRRRNSWIFLPRPHV